MRQQEAVEATLSRPSCHFLYVKAIHREYFRWRRMASGRDFMCQSEETKKEPCEVFSSRRAGSETKGVPLTRPQPTSRCLFQKTTTAGR